VKLIINAGPVKPAILTVVNGDDVIATTQVYGGSLKSAIDRIFKERYIEAVEFTEHNDYTDKFKKHIEDNYELVEVN